MKNKEIIIIAALGKNNELGKNNKLLFNIKEDMRNFKKLTSNNIVIMGRKTFESLNSKPLPNRLNIVISRNAQNYKNNENNVLWFSTIEDAIYYVNNINDERKVYIIGGGKIYKEVLDKNICHKMILTIVNESVNDADTYFPIIDNNKWNEKILLKEDNYSIIEFFNKFLQK